MTNKPDKKKRNSYPHATPEVFIRTCEEIHRQGGTAADVANQLQMPKDIVLARIGGYRKKGIIIPKLRRENPKGLNVAELNRRSRQVKDGNAQPDVLASPRTTLPPPPSHRLAERQDGGHPDLHKRETQSQDIATIVESLKRVVNSVGKDQTRRLLDLL